MRGRRRNWLVLGVLLLGVVGVGGLLPLLWLDVDSMVPPNGTTQQEERQGQAQGGQGLETTESAHAVSEGAEAPPRATAPQAANAERKAQSETATEAAERQRQLEHARQAAQRTGRSIPIPGLRELLAERRSHQGGVASGASRNNGEASESPTSDATQDEAETEEAALGHLQGHVIGRERDGRDLPLARFRVEVHTETETHTAITDESGVYRLAQLKPGPVEVRPATWGEGPDGERIPQIHYEPVTRTGLIEAGTSTHIDLTVRRAFDVAGVCLDPQGRPIEGAHVRLFREVGWNHRPSEADHVATSDRDGVFRIHEVEDTVHRLYADAQELPRAVKEGFRPSDYGPDRPLTIVFEDAHAISGRVFDEQTGEPLAAARITASHHVEGGQRIEATVLSGPDGYYRVPVAEASMNRVRAARAGYDGAEHRGILPGRSGLDFQLTPNERSGVIGRLLDVDGEAAQRFTLNGETFANALGQFDLELEPGPHTLHFRSEESGGLLEHDVEVPPGPELHDVGLLMLLRGETVEVRLLDPHDEPVRDATVRLRTTGQEVGPLSGETDRYRFTAVPPGEGLRFEVEHELYASKTRKVPAEEVPFAPNLLVVRLHEGDYGAQIQVRTVTDEPLAGAEIAWLVGEEPRRSATSDEAGLATLTGLAANPARIRVRAEGFASEKLDVPTASAAQTEELPETTVTLEPGGSVWGELTARGRALPHGGAVLPEIQLRLASGGVRTTVPVEVTLPGDEVRWRYEFPEVAPGEAWLSVPEFQLFETQSFQVAQGEPTRRDLDLPGYGTLRVTLRDHDDKPGGNLTCYLYTLDTFTVTRFETTNSAGLVEYPYLPPGGWALSVITHGSSDQRLYEIQMPEGQASHEHEIQLPKAPYEIRGRLLVEDDTRTYTENTQVTTDSEIHSFELSVLLADDETEVQISANDSSGFGSAAAVASALEASKGAQQIGLQASVGPDETLVLEAANPATLEFFRVEPADANARQLFGTGPFDSSHAAEEVCQIALEHIDVPLQTLLAGYISVDAQGEFTLAELVAGHYRPRAVPHYTNAPYAQTFGRDVEVGPSNPSPFVTIWTHTDGYVNVSGTLHLDESGHHPGANIIVFVDGLSDPPTQYPPSASPHRGKTQRSGYYFGSFNGREGSYTIPRLRRGQRYRAWIYVTGLEPVAVEFDVPNSGPTTLNAPAAQTGWDARFVRGTE